MMVVAVMVAVVSVGRGLVSWLVGELVPALVSWIMDLESRAVVDCGVCYVRRLAQED